MPYPTYLPRQATELRAQLLRSSLVQLDNQLYELVRTHGVKERRLSCLYLEPLKLDLSFQQPRDDDRVVGLKLHRLEWQQAGLRYIARDEDEEEVHLDDEDMPLGLFLRLAFDLRCHFAGAASIEP